MLKQQKIIWSFGLSGSGESTLAQAHLKANKHQPYVCLDDDVRSGISKELGFDSQGCLENIRRIAEIAKLLFKQKFSVMVSGITSLLIHLQVFLKNLNDTSLKLIFCKSSLKTCNERDVKVLYKKVNFLEILSFNEISSTFKDLDLNSAWIKTQDEIVLLSFQEFIEMVDA